MICQCLTRHPAATLCSLVFGLVHHECDVVFQPVLCWLVASSRRRHTWHLLPVCFLCEYVPSEKRLVSQGCTSGGRMAGMGLGPFGSRVPGGRMARMGCGSVRAPNAKNTPPSCLGVDHRTRPGSQPTAQRDLGWNLCRGSLGPLHSAQPGSAPHPML